MCLTKLQRFSLTRTLKWLSRLLRNNHAVRVSKPATTPTTSIHTNSPLVGPSVMETEPPDWRMLPDEIWLRIFNYATYIQTDQITPILQRNHSSNSDTEYRFVMRAKIQLTLVCREWYALAIELLYSDVRRGSVAKLRELVKDLRDSLETETSSKPLERGSGHGWWTRRLEVAIDSVRRPIPQLEAIMGAARMMPNLSSLIIHNSFPYDQNRRMDELMLSICVRLKNTLRELSYISSSTLHSAFLNAQLLDTLPQLKRLTLSSIPPSWPDGRPLVNHTVTHLTLLLDRTISVPWPDTEFNALRHLTLYKMQRLNVPLALKILDAYGPNLTSLWMSREPPHQSSTTDPAEDDASFIERCPRLEEVIFLTEPFSNRAEPAKFPSIRRVGIDMTSQDLVPFSRRESIMDSMSRYPNMVALGLRESDGMAAHLAANKTAWGKLRAGVQIVRLTDHDYFVTR